MCTASKPAKITTSGKRHAENQATVAEPEMMTGLEVKLCNLAAEQSWRAPAVEGALASAHEVVRYQHLQRAVPLMGFDHGPSSRAYRGKTGSREAFNF